MRIPVHLSLFLINTLIAHPLIFDGNEITNLASVLDDLSTTTKNANHPKALSKALTKPKFAKSSSSSASRLRNEVNREEERLNRPPVPEEEMRESTPPREQEAEFREGRDSRPLSRVAELENQNRPQPQSPNLNMNSLPSSQVEPNGSGEQSQESNISDPSTTNFFLMASEDDE